MAFMEPVPGKPYIKNGGAASGDVSGIVGMSGNAEDVGGNVNRTVRLEMSVGKVWVKTSGNGEKEI